LRDTFRKTGPESALEMFEAEVDGLNEIRATREIRVPEVIDCGVMNGESYLDLERLHFERPSGATEGLLGKQLAKLHRHTQERFGWFRDNTIGLTPQVNTWSGSWISFFREHRLEFQLELAIARGYGADVSRLGKELSYRLPELFEGYEPAASLLHGDLWGGNWGCVNGQPVLFDPAVHYGDRESDIAMTMLFGGFGRPFYEAYEKGWPMAPGHEQRLKLYQLYHVLNHLNLFGRSYLGRAVGLLKDLT
jgi:fructosamine-3-kinase